jgi:GNAT superfamily N-acetyltransferase
VESLDRYFREHAGQDVRTKIAAVFVLYDNETETIVGFYTLRAFGIHPQSLPPDVLRRLPRYDLLPASLLGRLAVDTRYRRQGFGELLLLDALRRSWEQSAVIGAMAVVVDAKDDAARTFYERYGFRRFLDAEYRLYLPMRTVEQTLRGPH